MYKKEDILLTCLCNNITAEDLHQPQSLLCVQLVCATAFLYVLPTHEQSCAHKQTLELASSPMPVQFI